MIRLSTMIRLGDFLLSGVALTGWRLEDPSRTCEYKSFKEWRSPGWRVEDPSGGFLALRSGAHRASSRARIIFAGEWFLGILFSSISRKLGAEGLHRREPCCSCARKVRCCLRFIGRAAQTARDGERALTVVRQRVGLWVSRSFSPKRFLRAKFSSVVLAGVRKPSSRIALRGVCCRGCGLGFLLDCTKSSK